jgi:hypothetical protein
MLRQVLGVSDDKQMLEWGIRMYVVSRQLERIGDNAVDIAEQVAFLITGEFREFTDASHPRSNTPSCWRAAVAGVGQPCRPGQPPVHDPRGKKEPLGRLPGRHARQHEDRRRHVGQHEDRLRTLSLGCPARGGGAGGITVG